jgi:cystathionine beta-lyase
MGIAACKAAYGQGEPWLNELLLYLHGNLRFLCEFLRDKLPGARLIIPEGTYLCWLDMRGLSPDPEEVNRLIVHKARLWLDDGRMFGAGGGGFQRINIACPRPLLKKALNQLASAF